MKEFGSEFYNDKKTLEFYSEDDKEGYSVLKQIGIPFKAKLLKSGREAISFIASDIVLSQKSDRKIVLLPDLICESMVRPFEFWGFEVLRYAIKDFNIDLCQDFFEKLKKADAIMLMNYYGFSNVNDTIVDEIVKKAGHKIITIYDITHILPNYSFLSTKMRGIDYFIGSYRKLFGIVCGGLAVKTKGNFLASAEALCNDDCFVKLRKSALDKKREYVDGNYCNKDLKTEFRSEFAKADEFLEYGECKLADIESEKILINTNEKWISQTRIENYQALYDMLREQDLFGTISLFRNLSEDKSLIKQFMFPIYINNDKRDVFQSELAKRGVYTQVLWPTYFSQKEQNFIGDFSKGIVDNVLAVPIDQRYGTNDMEIIANSIIDVSKKLRQKKLLIIGASILQLPAIKKAKEMDLYVGVVDYNPNAIGIKFADDYFNCSTIDKNGILEICKQFKPDGIMTMATDMPMRSIAYVCEKLNLQGISVDTSIVATDKVAMIKRLKEKDVASPLFYTANSILDLENFAQYIEYPCIIKPADSSGSRGVSLCNSFEELKKEFNYSIENSKNNSVIIEEYMRGDEVSVETFSKEGVAYVLQVTDKVTTGAPHFVEIAHRQPSKYANDNAVLELAKKAALALGIDNGPSHIEIMVTKNGPKIIELGARMGGDCITSHLVPLSTGIDMTKQTILSALGENTDLAPTLSMASVIVFFNSDVGKIEHIDGVNLAEKIPFVKEVGFFKSIGDVVGNIYSSADRVGYVIAQAQNVNIAEDACNKAITQIKIVVKK